MRRVRWPLVGSVLAAALLPVVPTHAVATEVVAVVSSPNGLQLATFRVRSTTELEQVRSRPEVLAAGMAATRALPASPTGMAPAGFPAGEWGRVRLGGDRITAVGDGAGVVVAVLDTGVDATHPELQGRVLEGRDFVDPSGDARRDPNGHGTHVAGLVAAAADGTGITGVAPGAQILPVRVLAADGNGDDGVLALGIVWAAEHGADVLNLSIGGAVPSTLLEDAITFALDRGALVVVSAGNDGAFTNTPSYPAAYPAAFAVGAIDSSDRRSIFSNTGSYLDIAAPGSWIRSTWPGGGYQTLSGTSMAAPFVAGTAAVVLARTGLRGRELAARLSGDAVDLGPTGRDNEFGSGLINPLAVIGESATPTAPTRPVLPAPALPALPALPAWPAVPALPTLPALPTPTLPSLPTLTPPATPGVPTLPTTPLLPPGRPALPVVRAVHQLRIVLSTRGSGLQRRLVLRLEGATALIARRRLEVVLDGRTTTVTTDWKGVATLRLRRTTVVIARLPASPLHAEVSTTFRPG